MTEIIYLDEERFCPGAWHIVPGEELQAVYTLSEEEVEILSGAVVVDRPDERIYRITNNGFPTEYVRVEFYPRNREKGRLPLFRSVVYLNHDEIESLLFNRLKSVMTNH